MNRNQILDEMGLSPRWKVREQPAVVCGTKKAPLPEVAVASIQENPAVDALVLPAMSGTVNTGEIAQMGWEVLRQTIFTCRSCGLCAERKQAVPGVGDEKADWLFIGEGPGAEEDARGEPFVGQAGKLLDAMLMAIGLRRGENVYIANAVKCRPPANRTPETVEIAACFPYLNRQIALIQPKLIVLLGRAAAHAVLGEEGSLASLRGKTLTYRCNEQEIPVVVTYHPAYLLRTLPDKAKSWEDLCRARALMHKVKVE